MDLDGDGVPDFDLADVARDLVRTEQIAGEIFSRVQLTNEPQVTPSAQLIWHPILNVVRAHPGIDYAASKGTPIWSVGDGTVVFRGWAGASGNLVKIRHAGGYVSQYAHLSGFAKSLRVGQTVRQKEVIGFVGDTGLATGPHVCFRLQRHGRYVNPLEIASPSGANVTGSDWRSFELRRDLLLGDLGSGTLVAADEAL